jgi:hypothetical protein
MQHLTGNCPKKGSFDFHLFQNAFQAQVRFLAYHRIKPHAPPLVRAPVNSFEFQPCDRTPQVDILNHFRLATDRVSPTRVSSFTAWTTRVSNPVCSPRFRASASVIASNLPSQSVFCVISTHFTATPHIPPTLQLYSSPYSINGSSTVKPRISPLTYLSAYAPFKPNKSG